MFKGNNRNTSTRCEICSKLKIKTVERRHWRHIAQVVLVFLLMQVSVAGKCRLEEASEAENRSNVFDLRYARVNPSVNLLADYFLFWLKKEVS